MKTNRILPLVLLAFAACKSSEKRTYAIRDFRKDLQPYLVRAVTSGIVGDESSWTAQKKATDEELKMLSQSELPTLRAIAFREMLKRKSFNHLEIILSHLNDTALITTDAGEWGIEHSTVADDMIKNAVWKDSTERQKAIDSVIINHNYLRSAYSYRILLWIEPEEKYYASIKQMAEREGWFGDIELALYALAKYKKQDDISFIKEKLMSNVWRITTTTFRLMRDYPNEVYLEVLRKYFRSRFYTLLLEDHTSSDATAFIETVGAYKNNQSAELLDSILNRKPFIPYEYSRYYSVDTKSLKEDASFAIWNNPCSAYTTLRKQVAGRIQEYEKNQIGMEVDMDTSTTFPIRW